jgi:type IV-A pilus assembly ATPase PilB
MVVRKKRLGEILQDIGLVTEEQLYLALEEQKVTRESLGTILIKMGIVNSESLSHALATQFGMTVVKLSDEEIQDEALRKVPPAVARRQKIVPIKFENNILTVAMADPLDFLAIDNLCAMLGCEVVGVLSTLDDIEAALNKNYGTEEKTVDTMLDELSETDIDFDVKQQAVEEESDDAAIVKLVSLIILEAFRERASDIHIEPLEKKFRIRYRVDGMLHEVPGPPRNLRGPVTSRLKIMAGMDIAEKRLPQDGRIKLNLLGKEVDLRVSTLPGLFGESVVLRILDKSSVLLGLEELGFMGDDLKRFESILAVANGIFLVTGPTGSGKTTTLYAALHTLNRPDRKIITVEEPVEYLISGINQSQVRTEIGLTFARVLRSMLRQAPDIIMVGEIRDTETAEISIRAALTGHLVFSTLHTNDAPSAITRLIDMGVKPFLVASSVQAILAQRLVRIICENCKESYEPRMDELIQLGLDPSQKGKTKLYRGKGCSECNHTGYKGRQGIFELMNVSHAIQEMTMRSAPASEIREQAHKDGMKTLREDGIRKALDGRTTLSEVMRMTQQDVS